MKFGCLSFTAMVTQVVNQVFVNWVINVSNYYIPIRITFNFYRWFFRVFSGIDVDDGCKYSGFRIQLIQDLIYKYVQYLQSQSEQSFII